MEKKKNNKKKYLALLLALFVCAGGTMAWLTSTNELKNTFTVGQINKPVDNGGGPDNDSNWDENKKDKTKLSGNLYEPSWTVDSKIYPTAVIPKDPYVGVGPKSEEAYIFVMVKNDMDNVYFDINPGYWEPVTDSSNDELCATKFTLGTDNSYTSGLFKYKETLNNLNVENKNLWTKYPLFDNVNVYEKAVADDFDGKNIITVQSYVHQAKGYSEEGTQSDDLSSTAITNAIKVYNEWKKQ